MVFSWLSSRRHPQPSAHTDGEKLRAERKRLFANPRTDMLPLVLTYIDMVGNDVEVPGEHIQWDPAVIVSEIARRNGAEPDPLAVDKLLFGLAILSNDEVFKSPLQFNTYANVLDGIGVGVQEKGLPIADAYGVTWAILSATLLKGEIPQLGPEVAGFINEVIQREGLITLPKILAGLEGIAEPKVDFADLANEPEMFSAIAQAQVKNADSIDKMIYKRTLSLAKQLSTLKLEDGDTEPVVEALTNVAKKLQPASTIIIEEDEEDDDSDPDA